MRRAGILVAGAAAVLAAALPASDAASAAVPALGRWSGQTGEGFVFSFRVERSAKAPSHRKITHFYVVYDIAGCRSGPIRQPVFALVSKTGAFSRSLGLGAGAAAGTRQLRLTGRFTTPTRASGTYRVGIKGRCDLDPASPALTFTIRRAGA